MAIAQLIDQKLPAVSKGVLWNRAIPSGQQFLEYDVIVRHIFNGKFGKGAVAPPSRQALQAAAAVDYEHLAADLARTRRHEERDHGGDHLSRSESTRRHRHSKGIVDIGRVVMLHHALAKVGVDRRPPLFRGNISDIRLRDVPAQGIDHPLNASEFFLRQAVLLSVVQETNAMHALRAGALPVMTWPPRAHTWGRAFLLFILVDARLALQRSARSKAD